MIISCRIADCINYFSFVCWSSIFVVSPISLLTRSIRDSETSIDFVQGPPGSRRTLPNHPYKEKNPHSFADDLSNNFQFAPSVQLHPPSTAWTSQRRLKDAATGYGQIGSQPHPATLLLIFPPTTVKRTFAYRSCVHTLLFACLLFLFCLCFALTFFFFFGGGHKFEMTSKKKEEKHSIEFTNAKNNIHKSVKTSLPGGGGGACATFPLPLNVPMSRNSLLYFNRCCGLLEFKIMPMAPFRAEA